MAGPSFPRALLALNSVAIGLIGALYLFDPNLLLSLYGLETGSAGMDNMLRASYGGLYLVSAALFMIGARSEPRRRDALAFLGVFMAAAALGRVASMVAVGAPPLTITGLLAYECVAAGLALLAYKGSPSSARARHA